MIKKLLVFVLAFSLIGIIKVKALSIDELPKDELFHVISLTYEGFEDVGSADSYDKALEIFNNNVNNYGNLTIFSNGTFYKAEYAIVTFKSSDKCDYNVEFRNDDDKLGNYLNGCYGFDGAYLDTSKNGKEVKFKISGIVGWAKMDDVTIFPQQLLPGRTTKYKVINNELFHQIKQNFNTDYYGSLINLGPAPTYLEDGKEYYSYDGHYFYNDDSLWMMLDDYKNNNYNQSINVNDPYYNYYQYVSHRTITNYDETSFNNYLKDVLHIDNNIKSYMDLDKNSADDTLTNSQLHNQAFSFFQYQYQYGANALMMLSLSWNETALGRSSLAFTRNNLFGHAAYDSDVEKNASRYMSLSSSVYSHARYYISNSYCNPSKFQYHGCFFGNKSSGMNVSYASDPYWGEKAASNYYKFDEALGMKDLNKYTVGIKNNLGVVNVYKEPTNESNVLYKTDTNSQISFLILDSITNENGDWYKIQSDVSLSGEHSVDANLSFDFNNSVGFIKQSDVQVVLNGKNESFNQVRVTFDAGSGLFRDGSNKVSYLIEDNKIPSIETPTLENNLFISWDKDIQVSNIDTTYTAVYKEVESIEIKDMPITQFEIKDRINIKNGTVLVKFTDKTEKVVPLDTTMVSGFDFNVEGDQDVIVTYGGKTTSYKINASKELDDIRASIKEEILRIVESYLNKETLNETEVKEIIDLKLKVDEYMLPYLNQQQLRDIDKIVRKAIGDKVNYVVTDNKYDASISGLSMCVKLEDSLNKGFIKDTYKMVVSDKVSSNAVDLMSKVASGYGYTVISSFNVKAEKNFSTFKLHAPVVISIAKPENSSANQLFTVLRYVDNEVVECYTKQSTDFIQFMTSDFGEFMVVAKNTTNTYDIEDFYENVSVKTSDSDQYGLLSMGFMFGNALLIGVIVIVLMRKKKKND